jgi:thiol-disulfide isomerase/thioredoxin
MKRRRLVLAGAAVAAGAAGLVWRLRQEQRAAEQGLPDAWWSQRWPTPDGGEIAMAAWRGKPILVNFWATWCAPCVREMPAIDRFRQDHPAWQVLGVAIDQAEPVREFLLRVPVRFAIVLAGADGLQWSLRLGNLAGGLPFTVAISADGRIIRRKAGETTIEELAAWARAA